MVITKKIITDVGKDMDILKHLYVTSRNVKWCTCFITVWQFMKMLNIKLRYDLVISL